VGDGKGIGEDVGEENTVEVDCGTVAVLIRGDSWDEIGVTIEFPPGTAEQAEKRMVQIRKGNNNR
jgi:hypothetical protein